MLTPEEQQQIAAIKARLSAITPGPWEARYIESGHILITEGGSDIPIASVAPGECAAFIAHAPEDITRLLAIVERLKMELAYFDDVRPIISRIQYYMECDPHAESLISLLKSHSRALSLAEDHGGAQVYAFAAEEVIAHAQRAIEAENALAEAIRQRDQYRDQLKDLMAGSLGVFGWSRTDTGAAVWEDLIQPDGVLSAWAEGE
jgi:hypothetical protein